MCLANEIPPPIVIISVIVLTKIGNQNFPACYRNIGLLWSSFYSYTGESGPCSR